jgi:hypothetical protein
MVEKLMRNAWFLQQEIIGCKPWRMGILRNCLLRPSSPYCRKKTMPKGRSSPSPDRCFFNETQTQILDDSKNPDCRKPQAGVLHIATQAKLSRLDLAVDRAPPNPIPPSSTGTLLQKCGNYLRQSLFFVFKGWGIIFQQVD